LYDGTEVGFKRSAYALADINERHLQDVTELHFVNMTEKSLARWSLRVVSNSYNTDFILPADPRKARAVLLCSLRQHARIIYSTHRPLEKEKETPLLPEGASAATST
jgi:hypothetical protein